MTIDQLIHALEQLGSGFKIDKSEQELADLFLTVLSDLLPGRRLAVRLVRSKQLTLMAQASTEDLSAEQLLEFPLFVTCVDAEQLSSLDELQRTNRLILDSEYHSPFTDTAEGFSLPIIENGALLGMINVESGAQPVEADADRKLVGALAHVLLNIVSNRRLSRSATFLGQRVARIIETANALIFVLNGRHHLMLFNRELAERTGLPAAKVLGTDILQWLAPGDRRGFLRVFQQALEGRSITGYEMTWCGVEGKLVRTSFNLARPVDFVGAGSIVVAIGQDVTPVKLLEHQMIQAEKLATLGQLAAGVVHEINNPLTSITVYSDFLIKKFKNAGCDPADVAMLEKILDGSNRILKFTRDLVDYGKPSEERIDALSIQEIIEQSISFCEHILDKAGARLTVRLAPDLAPIQGVKDQLHQVVINLITNACHSLGESGGDISIRTWATADDYISIEVVDTGCGIGISDLPQIFEPFFSTKTPGKGTGLGLSIVKKIVDFHNGSIMVQSEIGEGTTFCVSLPKKLTKRVRG